jgi:hypothetical protein
MMNSAQLIKIAYNVKSAFPGLQEMALEVEKTNARINRQKRVGMTTISSNDGKGLRSKGRILRSASPNWVEDLAQFVSIAEEFEVQVKVGKGPTKDCDPAHSTWYSAFSSWERTISSFCREEYPFSWIDEKKQVKKDLKVLFQSFS